VIHSDSDVCAPTEMHCGPRRARAHNRARNRNRAIPKMGMFVVPALAGGLHQRPRHPKGCTTSIPIFGIARARGTSARKRGVAWLAVLVALSFSFCSGADLFKKYGKLVKVGPNPSAIAAADLNNDGLPEIVTADTGAMNDPRQERPANDEVSVMVAAGDLEYVGEPRLRTDFAPYSIAIGNVDALKAPDIVVGCFMATHHNDLWLFRNIGDNLFESTSFRVPIETLPYKRMLDGDQRPVFTVPGITSIALADFNGDGYRDVVCTGWCSDVLIYFPGVPDKYFGEPRCIPATDGPRDIRAADLDGDGHLDVVVALYSSNEVGIWKGNGDGTFAPAARFSSRGRLPNKVQVADVNRDGKPDIIVSHCYSDDSIVIFYGEGAFSFSTSQEIVLGPDRNALEHEIRDLVVTDLNSDKKPDIAAACFASKQVVVLINDSAGNALPQTFRRETYTFGDGRPRALCTTDLNKDGSTDLLVALWEENSVAFLLGQAPKSESPAKR